MSEPVKNEALDYLVEKIESLKLDGVIRFDIVKDRLERRFDDIKIKEAINHLVDAGYFVADYTETTNPYNPDVKNNTTNYFRFEWD
ncbi:MAG: hypothetical protein ACPHVJ_03055 [Psychrobacter sp.]